MRLSIDNLRHVFDHWHVEFANPKLKSLTDTLTNKPGKIKGYEEEIKHQGSLIRSEEHNPNINKVKMYRESLLSMLKLAQVALPVLD